jgi:DNA-directed RNA polymerase specialized sigma24 family protein
MLLLHGLDAEALCRRIVTRAGLGSSREDREDATQDLLLALWQLAQRFDPECGQPFEGLATAVLKRRAVDYRRRQFRTVWKFRDRVHERPRPQFVEFNGSVRARLDAIESARAGDLPGGDEDGRGLLAERDRRQVEDYELLGLPPAA